MKNRILSFVLCVCTLFSSVGAYLPAVAVDLSFLSWFSGTDQKNEPEVRLFCDGVQIGELTIGEFEKRTVSVVAYGVDTTSSQWQILMPDGTGVWVDVLDKTAAGCEVSSALVEGMLNADGEAYLRCKMRAENGVSYCSAPVRVKIVPSNTEYDENVKSTYTAVNRYASNEAQVISDDNETQTYVSVTINYLRIENGEEIRVYKPYVANIVTGSAFAQTIISPTLLGYAPYYDSDGDGVLENASSIVFDIGSVSEDIAVNVYYKPIEVNYAVKYFFQNIGNDLYTENAGLYDVRSALTGTVVTDDMLKLSDANSAYTVGFTKMYHIPDEVAADGSTVFECYYDRLYYLLIFDNNGGYGTDPIYARYGTPFVVNDPIRYGYIFKGWDVDGNGIIDENDKLPSSIEVTNDENGTPVPVTYRAVWERADTQYTVAYWIKDNSGKQYFVGSTVISEKSGAYVNGDDTLFSDKTYICGKAEHIHDSSCISYSHIHSESCINGLTKASPSGADTEVILGACGGDEIKDGFLYTINVASNATDTWYYLRINGEWYSGDASMKAGDVIGEYTKEISGYNNTYTARMYYPSLSSCTYSYANGMTVTCDKDTHTHTSECVFASRYLEFVSADQNVEVAGDGSTVVNVYYKYKDYTLRFYYARSSEDTDGSTVYEVVGGSTYAFGAQGNSTQSVADLLKNPPDWGKVKTLPKINDDYINNADLIEKYHLRSGQTDSDFDSDHTYYYLEFTASFSSDISEVWPVDIFESVEVGEKHATHSGTNTESEYCPYKYAYFSAWNGQYGVKYSHSNTNQTIKGLYQYLDENLIFDPSLFPDLADETEISYLCFWENGADVGWSIPKIFEYNIYLENKSGDYELFRTFNVYDDSKVDQQTKATIDGYSWDRMESTSETDETTGLEKYVIKFYYKLETQNYLHFYNYNKTEHSISGIQYGTSLSEWLKNNGYGDYIALPKYPDELEENAYSFAGWYTTSECYEGTEFDIESEGMPSNDLTLYARWKPVSHEVNFFVTLDELREYESGGDVTPYYSCTGDKKVLHGNVVGSLNSPENGELTFKGWFYIDEKEGGKKAFVPTAMPINKDLNIYAEWESHTAVQYRIRYVLLYDPNTSVADDTIGYAYASTTKTFQAKAGEPLGQLYEQYNHGYYPTVSSHSITMQLDPEDNVYTFYYTHVDKIGYTVNYINKETNILMDTEYFETDKSIVTVVYKHYENMIPDAFYKQLVLSVSESDNVITFYYTPNNVKVYYAVHYMLAKLGATEAELNDYSIDGSGGYEDSDTYYTGIADKGKSVTVSSAEFTGFTVTNIARIVSGSEQRNANTSDGGSTFTIDELSDGDELYIFYTRDSYDYKVHYYQYNTTIPVKQSLSGSAQWGSEINFDAPDIDGYECVNLESDGKRHLTVKEGENELIFYYSPVQRVIEYVAVVDGSVLDGAGRLSNSREIVAGSEIIIGSVAHSDVFYRFDGWYADEKCTVPLVDGTHGSLSDEDGDGICESFIPSSAALSEKNTNVFYAHFVPVTGDITVKVSGSTADQISVVEIKNMLTGDVILATVVGDGEVTVKNVHLNNYTICVSDDWSWRYKDSTVTCEHSNVNGTTVQLVLVRENEKWLSAQSGLVKNIHGEVGTNG